MIEQKKQSLPKYRTDTTLEKTKQYFHHAKFTEKMCAVCHPRDTNVSGVEQEIREYVKLLYSGEILYNNRTVLQPLELDLYMPEINMAIEVNGTYWHSELVTAANGYHRYPENIKKA